MCKLLGLTLTLLFSFPHAADAQKEKDIPGWGKIDKADLELKEGDFDKNAETIVLFDLGELVSYDLKLLELQRHIRIKILNDKGKTVCNSQKAIFKNLSTPLL